MKNNRTHRSQLNLFSAAAAASDGPSAMPRAHRPTPVRPQSPHSIPVFRTDLVKDRDFIGGAVTSPRELGELFCQFLGRCPVEHFAIAMLSNQMRVVGLSVISVGTVNMAPVWIPAVFRPAILANVPRIACGHNHPSLSTTPSAADLAITKKLVEAGRLLDIEVVDHFIVGDGFSSLAEMGYL